MSTRSIIAVHNEDGSLESSVIYRNGSPSELRATLNNHYNTLSKVHDLIHMGDVYKLGTTIKLSTYPFEGDGSIFFLRDKDILKFKIAKYASASHNFFIHQSYASVIEFAKNLIVEYIFIWHKNAWYFKDVSDLYDMQEPVKDFEYPKIRL